MNVIQLSTMSWGVPYNFLSKECKNKTNYTRYIFLEEEEKNKTKQKQIPIFPTLKEETNNETCE